MKRVLDFHGLMVFFERKPGFEKVESLLIDVNEKDWNLMMTAVCFGEVYYTVLREYGLEKANEIEKIIQTFPIDIISVDVHLTKEAARFKAFKKISYADCFAAALAKINRAALITGDKEFKEVEDEIKILWI